MSEHLTFDEIVNFLDASEINGETRKLAFRVNEHIYNCNECYQYYNSLQELNDQIELIKRKEINEEKAMLFKALKQQSDPSLSKRAIEWIKKLYSFTSEIAFNIASKDNITILNSRMNDDIYAYDFGHPMPIGARGYNTEPKTTTVLVDNENEANQIKLTDPGTIRIELDSTDYSTGPLAFLVNCDGKAWMEEMDDNTGVIMCEFKDIAPGEYTLYIE